MINKFADAGLIEEYNSDFLSLKEGKKSLSRVKAPQYLLRPRFNWWINVTSLSMSG